MQVKTRALLKIGLLTNLFEWYEFSIYGYLAGILGQLFFKTTQPVLALLLGFLPFTVSYLVRPAGSLILGLIGDQVSRQKALNLSLFMMSVPTVVIGLLPTYDQIGNLAIVCLVLLRLIQGFGAGGEVPISGCYIFENAEFNRKGLLGSTVNIGGILGFLTGSLASTLLIWFFDQKTIFNWAWRIPFLLGVPITAYIFYLRKSVFAISAPHTKSKNNMTHLFREHKANLLKVILISGFSATCYYSLILWMPAYLTYFIGIPQKVASLMNTIIVCIMSLFWVVSGYLSDRVDYRKLVYCSVLAILFSAFPLFWTFRTQHYELIMLGQCFYALILSGLDAPLVLYSGNSFPSTIRALGMSLGMTLGATLGGMTPLICTWLIHQTGLLTAPAFYIMAFGLLALPAALTLKKP